MNIIKVDITLNYEDIKDKVVEILNEMQESIIKNLNGVYEMRVNE